MRRPLLGGLGLGLVIGMLLPAAAAACVCIAVSDRTLLRLADVAFAGTVTAQTQAPDDPAADTAYTLAVDTTVKGPPAAERTVAVSPSSCAVELRLGHRYLVLARRLPDRLFTDACSGTRPLAASAPVPDLVMRIPRRPHPVWWIGEGFEGLRLARVREVNGRVTFDYRTSAEGVVLSIRTVPVHRAAGARLLPLTDPRTVRAVPTGRRTGVLNVFTGRQQVRIVGDPALARRAAAALWRVGRPASRTGALPAPPRWSTTQGLGCPAPRSGEAGPPGCPVVSAP